MTRWRIFKRRDDRMHCVSSETVWVEYGNELETAYSYGFYDDDAQELGSRHGAGKYLLVSDVRVGEVEIAEHSEFRLVEPEPEPEPAAEPEASLVTLVGLCWEFEQ